MHVRRLGRVRRPSGRNAPGRQASSPPVERTLGNKETAVAYATSRALLYVFPEDEKWIAAEARKRGVDPKAMSTDPATPAGVGNAAAAAVIEFRRTDGANQHGDEVELDGTPVQLEGLTCEVVLKLPTFSVTAEVAGISRVMGGYHIQADNVEGLRLGRKLAEYVWPRKKAYFDGTADGR